MKMSSFDFTALLKFLGALFDAFVKLFEKLGFDFGNSEDGDADDEAADDNIE